MSYISNIIVETERTIQLLDIELQTSYRIIAVGKLEQNINKGSNYNITQKDNYILWNN